eukprot:CAMPEP_0167812090 /NCGR_PEP_ID=MMETSP0112_2-20121227/1050_1 /TAXON_ID=91324 /ORGANISM="Lotharella globosa, Strain CCCM811" /LENGTH=81 /DNA_ID=CAMNT_0007710913 /DNA_START=28 /DNA_END=269 /DNA_ORIENTATION=-
MGKPGDTNAKRKGLNFGFAGKPTKRRREAVEVQVKERAQKKILVSTLSQKKLRRIGAGEKKQIVIPLKKNNWKDGEGEGEG